MARSAISEGSESPGVTHDSVDARRRVRIVSLQVLYEVDSVRRKPVQALERILEAWPLSRNAQAQARDLIEGVIEHRDQIDEEIGRFAPSWPISQLATVDKNILRIAIYEMVVSRKAPPKVAINEAIEVAKAFGSDNAPKFINGVLGSVLSAKEQQVHT